MATGGLSFRPARRRRFPGAVVNAGGVGPPRSPRPKPGRVTAGGYIQPPFLTYDPGIEAQRRAAQRGLEDTTQNVKTEGHFAHTDLAQALRDLGTENARKRQDISLSAQRGERKLGYQEQDVQTRGARANQDFGTQLANISRQFSQLGQRQTQSANAAGVLDAGTQAASAAARGQNQQLAEAPIHTAQARSQEDLAEALRRLGTARGELGEDTASSLGRLGEDTSRSRMLAKREAGRKGFELKRKEGRAKREGAISNVDLLQQEMFQAQREHPGSFHYRAGRRKGRR